MAKTYDPNKIVISFAGIPVQGFADGTFVTVARNEQAFTVQVGSGGEDVRSKTNNKSGTATFTLIQSSVTNDLLSALAKVDELTNAGQGPLLIKDLSGTSLYAAEKAWIQKVSDSEYGREAGSREWVIETGNLEVFVGGIPS